MIRVTYDATVRGRWRRTWLPPFRYHVCVRGVWVRVPWLVWVMFS